MAVYKVVHELLERGDLNYAEIAEEVRQRIPDAQTTAKSVASHAVVWRRRRKAFKDGGAEIANPPIPPITATVQDIAPLIQSARIIACAYYQLTGRPLGITGEVGEYEAVRLLGLTLAPARQKGFDAIDDAGVRYQVKARRVAPNSKPGQRLGRIKPSDPFDAVLLVILDENLEARQIWHSERDMVLAALAAPGSRARNERGALSVSKFKSISSLRWTAD